MEFNSDTTRRVHRWTRSRPRHVRNKMVYQTLLCALVAGFSSSASADWFEELAKVALAKEVIEQVESREIIDLGLPTTIVNDEIDRTKRALEIKARFDIDLKKSQIRRKIKNCNYSTRECKL